MAARIGKFYDKSSKMPTPAQALFETILPGTFAHSQGQCPQDLATLKSCFKLKTWLELKIIFKLKHLFNLNKQSSLEQSLSLTK